MNKTAQYTLTIVVPVYNEQDNILLLEKALSDFMAACTTKSCVLFVNDGSKDKSLQLIQEVCLRNDDFLYLSFAKNAGLSAAIKAGIDYTRSEERRVGKEC